MPVKIKLSSIRGIGEERFAGIVQKACDEKNEWLDHMANVGRDPDKYQSYPRPGMAPEIERAINKEDVEGGKYFSDYEIEDDGLTPEQVLRQKKNIMIGGVSQLETLAKLGIVEPGRLRHYAVMENDIWQADQKRLAAVREAEIEKRAEIIAALPKEQRESGPDIDAAIGPFPTEEELRARVVGMRSAEDTAHLAAQDERRQKSDGIERHAAKLQHDIEDLTADNIDEWMPEPFPK